MVNEPNGDGTVQVCVDLAQRLLRNDEAALGVVLRSYGPVVGAAIQRKYGVLNSHDVDDILSAALAKLWQLRDRFDPAKGSLRASFFRIADHLAHDLMRHGWYKARRREVSLHDIHPFLAATTPAKQQDPETELSELEGPAIQLHLRQIVDSLPEAYRYIILADACARDRVAAAAFLARELDIPEGTVRVYRNRAMATIRVELSRLGYSIP